MVAITKEEIMGDDLAPDCENTQTQTQNSQIEWSQHNTPSYIPTIWGRLYSTKVSLSGKHCWKTANNPDYYGKNYQHNNNDQ